MIRTLLKRYWPAAIALFAWMLFAFPYFFGKVPFPGTYLVTFFPPWSATHGMPVKNNAMPDVITQIFPWKRLTMSAYLQGEMPLWNPYSFAGTSHIGNYQSAIFSPVNILFALLPEIDAWSVMILLQPLLAGLFMLLFLRNLGRSVSAAAIGALSFAFCGFIVVWMAYGTLGYAVLVLPLALFAADRWVRSGSPGYGALLSGSVAFSLLSGHFQMSGYVIFCVFLYIAGLFRFGGLRRVVTGIVWMLAGILIASPQIFPAYDSYVNAVRSSSFTKGEVIPWQYIATLFSPDFYGNPVTRNDWFGHYAEWAGFAGVIPLLLAGLSLVYARGEHRVRFFGMLLFLSLVLAYQTPVVDALFALRIPVFSTSSASRIIILFSLAVSVLSAYGIDALPGVWKKKTKGVLYTAAAMVLIPAVIWAVLLIFRPFPADKLGVAARNSVIPTLLACAAAVCVIAGRVAGMQRRTLVYALLLVLTAFDMYRFSSKWMPFDPREYVFPQTEVLSQLSRRVADGQWRVIGNFGNEAATAFRIPMLEGYDAVYKERYGRFLSAASDGKIGGVGRSVALFDENGRFALPVMEITGVKYYVHKMSDGRFSWSFAYWEHPEFSLVWQDPNFQIYEYSNALPRALLASDYTVAESDQKALDLLFAPDFDRKASIVLDREPVLRPSEGSGSAVITRYGTDRIEIQTRADTQKLLYLSDAYDTGWKAWVDTGEVPVYRANMTFRAVAVPAGEHTITFRYEPFGLRAGFFLSAFVTLGIAVRLLWKRNG